MPERGLKTRLLRLCFVAGVVAGLVGSVAPAGASFHVMAIGEVFAGTSGHAEADYVELAMLADGQDEVAGTRLRFYDADGEFTGTEVLENNLVDGDAGETILIATSEAATLFDVTPDFALNVNMDSAGGKVCFESPPAGDIPTVIDCASWGEFTGSSLGSGTPFRKGHAIPMGAAMIRKGNSPNLVDSADSSDDFKLDGPTPRNLSGDAGAVPGSVFSMTPRTLRVTEGDEEQIAVSRSGDTAESGSVEVLGRSGTAKGNDFAVSAALDFAAADNLEQAPLQILDDTRFEGKEKFWVYLTDPADAGVSGSALDTYPEIKVVITDDEVDNTPPATAVYRPKDGGSYRPGELKKIKGTATEDESGVTKVQVALRVNLGNGKCKWLKGGGGFTKGSCAKKRFVDARLKTRIEWRFQLKSRLLPSIDSKIKDYTVFSRGRDGAGNFENTVEDPNRARFEIEQPA